MAGDSVHLTGAERAALAAARPSPATAVPAAPGNRAIAGSLARRADSGVARLVARRAGNRAIARLLQRNLSVGGQQYTTANAAQAGALVGTSQARSGSWRQTELHNRAEALARGDATHTFATVGGLENSLILDIALVGAGTAWATPARPDTNKWAIDRINTISRDLQALFNPLFTAAPGAVTVPLLGFDFQRLANAGGGFWLRAVRNNRTNKVVNRDLGNYPRLAKAKADSLLNQIENRAHATVDEADLDALMAIIVSFVAEPRRWAGQNVFTALTLGGTIEVPEGRAVTGDIGVLPMSAGHTWDETALAPQSLARTRTVEALQRWLGNQQLTALFTALAADFDAAANLPAFQTLATTRLEALV